jgi:hypothetical protein
MVSIDAVLDLLDVVDLDRYPLNDPDSVAYADLVERCRAQLAETGASELEDFLNGPGLDLMLADAIELEPQAFRSGGLGTAYLGLPDETLPEDHPRRYWGDYGVGAVAYDLFPPDSPIRRLYVPAFARRRRGRGLRGGAPRAVGRRRALRQCGPGAGG